MPEWLPQIEEALRERQGQKALNQAAAAPGQQSQSLTFDRADIQSVIAEIGPALQAMRERLRSGQAPWVAPDP